MLNIRSISTGAESPWSNGLVERHHKHRDDMFLSLCHDFPLANRNTLLAWASSVKNSMHDNLGYSPNQLVFGKTLSALSIFNASPKALQATTTSQTLVDHINILHQCRLAYTKSDASERVRRALLEKIDTSGATYKPGDPVYYYRGKSWRGPAKVAFWDNKILWLCDGAFLVRVSTN